MPLELFSLAAISGASLCAFLAGTSLLDLVEAERDDVGALAHHARRVAATMGIGLSVYYLLAVVIGRIDLTAVCMALLAAVGAARLLMSSTHRAPRLDAGRIVPLLLAPALVLLAIGTLAAFTPLDWDGRSIWYFHAKIIHHLGGLSANEIWSNPDLDFAAVGYPKLAALLGAQFSALLGHWSEFAAKSSIVVVVLAATFALISFSNTPASLMWLGSMLLVMGIPWIVNGTMDGTLALIVASAALFAVRSLSTGSESDLATAIVFVGVANGLKVEGLVLLASLAIASCAAVWQQRPSARRLMASPTRSAAIIAVAFSGPIAWTVKKAVWGLPSGLHLNVGGDLLTNLAQRLPMSDLIFHTLFDTHDVGTSSLVLVAAAALAYGVGAVPRLPWFLPLVALTYFVAMFSVYLMGSADLIWMLDVSGSRTALGVHALLFAATFWFLAEIERRWSELTLAGIRERLTSIARRTEPS